MVELIFSLVLSVVWTIFGIVLNIVAVGLGYVILKYMVFFGRKRIDPESSSVMIVGLVALLLIMVFVLGNFYHVAQ